jgi:predicted TIM-barrel fold metal-dependent hydrolase
VERIEEYSGFPGARAGPEFHRGYTGKHLPKEYIQRGQIYFGFEVDEKLLPFAIDEFGDECWLYGSDIPHGDRLYGAVDVFLKREDISEESKQKLLKDNAARFYGLIKKSGGACTPTVE